MRTLGLRGEKVPLDKCSLSEFVIGLAQQQRQQPEIQD
jgi:hypothetical protein